MGTRAIVGVLALLLLVAGACSDDGGDEAATDSTTTTAVPTSTTAPVPTTVRLASPDLRANTLGLWGLGTLRIGASVDDLEAEGFEVGAWGECAVPFVRYKPSGVVLMRGIEIDENGQAEGQVTALYFDVETRNGQLTTHSGVGRGSTRAEVADTYGESVTRRSVSVEDYDPSTTTFEDRLEFVPVDEDDTHLRLIFSFGDDDTLSMMRTGEIEAVHQPTFCAPG